MVMQTQSPVRRPFVVPRSVRWMGVACALAMGSWTGIARAEKSIVVEYTESHDRVSPKPRSDIRLKRTIIATLGDKGTVSEQLKTTCMTCFGSTKKHKRRGGGGGKFEVSEDEEAELGSSTGKTRWTVVNSRTLKRVQQRGEVVDTITVRLVGPDRCEADVKFFRHEGKAVVRHNASYKNAEGDFTVPVLQSSSCSIEEKRS